MIEIDFIENAELLKPIEAANLFNVSEPTLRSWVKEFGIPQIVIRGRVRYRRSDLIKLIDAHTQTPGTNHAA
jgi:excisionase family DNA binding protein